MSLSLVTMVDQDRSNSNLFGEDDADAAKRCLSFPRKRVLKEERETFVAYELAKEPFNYKLNSASFHRLTRDEVLEIFSKILESIDPSQKIDAVHEEFEEILSRVFEFLRILGYRPPSNVTADDLQAGLEDGNHEILVPIMTWLLERKDKLKSRVYLAKFLVPIVIPLDLCADEDVVTAYDKYEKLVEQFKQVHKEKETLSDSKPISNLLSEIQRHERELLSLGRKTEAVKSRVSSYPEMSEAIVQLRERRQELSKMEGLQDELKLEKNELEQLSSRIATLKAQREKLFDKNRNMTPEQLLVREELERESLLHDVNHRLPRKIRQTDRKILSIQQTEIVASEGKLNTQFLRKRVHAERRRLEAAEATALKKDDAGEELVFTRQRAKGIRAKRQELEAKFRELEEELEVARSELAESQANCEGRIAEQEAVRDLTTAVRIRLGEFNKKKAEIRAVQAEGTVLGSTKFILEQKYTESLESLRAVEIQFGLEGYFEAKDQQEVSGVRPNKYQLMSDLSLSIGELTQKCQVQKQKLMPISKAVNSLRQQVCLTAMTYDDMRKIYEKTRLKAECQFSQIRMKVDHLNREIERDELKYLQVKNEIRVLKVNLERAKEEKVLFYGRSFREALLGKIIEEERRNKQLREDESKLEEYTEKNLKQTEYWTNIIKLLKVKIQLVSGESQASTSTSADSEVEDVLDSSEGIPPEEESNQVKDE